MGDRFFLGGKGRMTVHPRTGKSGKRKVDVKSKRLFHVSIRETPGSPLMQALLTKKHQLIEVPQLPGVRLS